jgi:hypothetical protein
MTCCESEGEEFLLPEADPADFCVVGNEAEPFVDEPCFVPTDHDGFDPAGRGDNGAELDAGGPETAEDI